MSKVTIYDVAKQAGVSTATVSKVLNGTGRVSKETIMRVERIVEELQYKPNLLASALKKNRTFTMGLLVPDVLNPFASLLIRAIEDAAFAFDYSVLACSTDNLPEREKKLVDALLSKRFDGIIIASSEFSCSSAIKELKKQDVRAVFVDRVLADTPYPIFATDHYLGSYLVTEHLVQLGHRKLAIFLEPLYLRSSLERLRGFSAALEAYGIAQNSFQVLSGGFGAESGYLLADQILQREDLPTAIVATTDLIAIGVLQKFHEVGIQVPRDISLVGYDDIPLARMAAPPLTTVAQPVTEMSKQIIECLLREEQQEIATTLLPPKLVVRASTAPPASSPLPLRKA
jgi:LacI family transcriptional regulator